MYGTCWALTWCCVVTRRTLHIRCGRSLPKIAAWRSRRVTAARQARRFDVATLRTIFCLSHTAVCWSSRVINHRFDCSRTSSSESRSPNSHMHPSSLEKRAKITQVRMIHSKALASEREVRKQEEGGSFLSRWGVGCCPWTFFFFCS